VRVVVTRTGAAAERALRVSLTLDGGAARWLLVPGVLYGENRPLDCRVPYPRWDPEPREGDPFTASAWSFRVDRAAVAFAMAWTDRVSAALAVDEVTPLGPASLGVEGTPEAARVSLTVPVHEAPVTYVGTEIAEPPERTFRAWVPGERQELEFRVFVAEPDRHAYDAVVRELERRYPGASVAGGDDLRRGAELAAEGLLRWHLREAPAILAETAAFERRRAGETSGLGDRNEMHIGWVSGIPSAAALLEHGRRTQTDATTAAALAVLEHCAAALAPSGGFWGCWRPDRGWGTGWTPDRTLHARTTAEATLFLGRAIAAERERGFEHPSWDAAHRSNLDLALRADDGMGDLGARYDPISGEVRDRRGAAGLAWVPALVEGAALRGDTRLGEVAAAAGERYAGFVEDEFVHGAPEDVDLAPTSEDGYVAVMAYVALATAEADAAQRERWLGLARRAADWTLTFRYAYDVQFASESVLGRAGFRTRGLDQASPANQHVHVYGCVCVPEMRTLTRLTGDARYAARADEHLGASLGLVSPADGDWRGQRGMVSERPYQTNCFAPKGGLLQLSHAWCAGLILWACEATIANR
jgi:hypothetical protein